MEQILCFRTKSILLFFLYFFFFSSLSAQNFVRTPDTKSLINAYKNEPKQQRISLTSALKKLEEKFSVNFGYTDQTIEGKFVSSEDIENPKLEETLRGILSPLKLKYQKIDEQFYLITDQRGTEDIPDKIGKQKPGAPNSTLEVSNSHSFAIHKGLQDKKIIQLITGKVTDSQSGGPLPGVNVLIKGTITGTVTGVDGNYTIDVPNTNDTLVFSSIGYVSQEIPVEGRSEINLSLSEDITSLKEIVVVGYGTQKKENVIGAISTIH